MDQYANGFPFHEFSHSRHFCGLLPFFIIRLLCQYLLWSPSCPCGCHSSSSCISFFVFVCYVSLCAPLGRVRHFLCVLLDVFRNVCLNDMYSYFLRFLISHDCMLGDVLRSPFCPTL